MDVRDLVIRLNFCCLLIVNGMSSHKKFFHKNFRANTFFSRYVGTVVGNQRQKYRTVVCDEMQGRSLELNFIDEDSVNTNGKPDGVKGWHLLSTPRVSPTQLDRDIEAMFDSDEDDEFDDFHVAESVKKVEKKKKKKAPTRKKKKTTTTTTKTKARTKKTTKTKAPTRTKKKKTTKARTKKTTTTTTKAKEKKKVVRVKRKPKSDESSKTESKTIQVKKKKKPITTTTTKTTTMSRPRNPIPAQKKST